jgi:hypothetical protein
MAVGEVRCFDFLYAALSTTAVLIDTVNYACFFVTNWSLYMASSCNQEMCRWRCAFGLWMRCEQLGTVGVFSWTCFRFQAAAACSLALKTLHR